MSEFIDDSGVVRFEGTIGGELDLTGPVTIEPTNPVTALDVHGTVLVNARAAGENTYINIGDTSESANLSVSGKAAQSADLLYLENDADTMFTIDAVGALAHNGASVGFYGHAPVAQQTGVAVSAAAIHAALVNLGLITA